MRRVRAQLRAAAPRRLPYPVAGSVRSGPAQQGRRQAGSAERPRIRSPRRPTFRGGLRAGAPADRRGFDRLPLAAAHHEREHEPLVESHPKVGEHDLAAPELPTAEESSGKPHEARHRRFAAKRLEPLVAVRPAHERHPRLRVQQRAVALEIPPICGHRDHSPEHRVERRRCGEVAGHPCRQGIAGHAVDVHLDDQREGEPGDAERKARVIEPVPEPALAREEPARRARRG